MLCRAIAEEFALEMEPIVKESHSRPLVDKVFGEQFQGGGLLKSGVGVEETVFLAGSDADGLVEQTAEILHSDLLVARLMRAADDDMQRGKVGGRHRREPGRYLSVQGVEFDLLGQAVVCAQHMAHLLSKRVQRFRVHM